MNLEHLKPLLECKDFLEAAHFNDLWFEADQEIIVIELMILDNYKHLATDDTMTKLCTALSELIEYSVGISLIYSYQVH